MFVNKVSFLVTLSQHIKFGTVEMLNSCLAKSIFKCINKVIRLYNKRSFIVKYALMDTEFETLKDKLTQPQINTVAASEHIPEIERYIRVIKERVQALKHTLPFMWYP